MSDPLELYHLNVYNLQTGSRNCTSTMLVNATFNANSSDRSQLSTAPTILGWMVIANSSNMTSLIMPSSHEKTRYCVTTNHYLTKVGYGIVCSCKNGCFGNPYIPGGCKASSKCKRCIGRCVLRSDGQSYYCPNENKFWLEIVLLTLGLGIGILFCCSGNFYACFRKRKVIKMKEKFFQQNGGLLLSQQLTLYGGTESTRIFKVVELKAATKNYSKNNILGKGRFGTVYKGVLSNQQVVAIKKSKISSQSQVEQFINEVVILT